MKWVAGVLIASGCSFATVRGPRPNATGLSARCTTSQLAPTLDTTSGLTIMALGGLMVLLSSFRGVGTTPDDEAFNRLERRGLIVGLAGLPLVASGIYGFKTTSSCHAASFNPFAPRSSP